MTLRIIAERRHLALLVGAHHFAAAGDHQHEVGVAHGLQRFHQAGRIGRALAIRPVTDMALGMIAAEAREGVPIDRAVAGDVVGRRAIGRLPFAVLFRLRRSGRPLARPDKRPRSGNEDQRKAEFASQATSEVGESRSSAVSREDRGRHLERAGPAS